MAKSVKIQPSNEFGIPNDTTPRHGDSRRSGRATYPQHEEQASRDQDNKPQRSLAGTGPNPNAVGPTMRQPYDEVSPMFEDSNGFAQTWNEQQALDAPGYPKKPGPFPG